MSENTDRSLFISVIICTFKRPLFLKKCLQSILTNTYEDYEIIVIGQGTDETPEIVIGNNFKNNRKIRYIHTEIVGLSHARNIGCQYTKGDVIAFIDDDAVASPDWLEGYAEAFQHIVPTPAIVGGKIEPDWEVPRPMWYPEERQFLLGIYNIGDTIQPFPETDLPIGANFAVLRSVLEEIGGFDSRVGFDNSRKSQMIAGEDSFLGLKVREAGYPIYYQPKAKVFHNISSSKLSRTFFLKRHFYEGITHMILEDCREIATPKRMFGNFIWHFRNILKTSGGLLKTVSPDRKNSLSVRMLRLSELAYSMGICIKSFVLLFKKWKLRLWNFN